MSTETSLLMLTGEEAIEHFRDVQALIKEVKETRRQRALKAFPELLTIKEAAELMGCDYKTVKTHNFRVVYDPDAPRRTRIYADDVRAWISQHTMTMAQFHNLQRGRKK